METSQTINKIVPAILAAQAAMGSAVKDSKNPFFKSSYADLNAVREAVMPALQANKIGVFQPTVVVNGKQYVRTLLLHESGEYLAADTEVVCAKQNDPQALGSAISYARRYGLQSFMNVAAVDDDGEASMNRPAAQAAKPSAPAATMAPPKEEKKSSFRKNTTPPPAETKTESANDNGWQ